LRHPPATLGMQGIWQQPANSRWNPVAVASRHGGGFAAGALGSAAGAALAPPPSLLVHRLQTRDGGAYGTLRRRHLGAPAQARMVVSVLGIRMALQQPDPRGSLAAVPVVVPMLTGLLTTSFAFHHSLPSAAVPAPGRHLAEPGLHRGSHGAPCSRHGGPETLLDQGDFGKYTVVDLRRLYLGRTWD